MVAIPSSKSTESYGTVDSSDVFAQFHKVFIIAFFRLVLKLKTFFFRNKKTVTFGGLDILVDQLSQIKQLRSRLRQLVSDMNLQVFLKKLKLKLYFIVFF